MERERERGEMTQSIKIESKEESRSTSETRLTGRCTCLCSIHLPLRTANYCLIMDG
jgi:hypothetical protein